MYCTLGLYVEVELDELTVLVGANNAGKTSFGNAMYAAIGAGRKSLGQDDRHLATGEAHPPLDRKVIIRSTYPLN